MLDNKAFFYGYYFYFTGYCEAVGRNLKCTNNER